MSGDARHIFFSPHADDVVLSCGGTIHELISRNEAVGVVGVFAGQSASSPSAYARHLHAKWRLSGDAITRRWQEDLAAMKVLGVKNIEHWNYLEAPYRLAQGGSSLYATDEELTGPVVEADRRLLDDIVRAVDEQLNSRSQNSVLYFPLGLGNHVDHQLLFDVGLRLAAAGRQVRFYEDFPYAQAYVANGHSEWKGEVKPVDVGSKARAAAAYASQLHGLGGSAGVLEQRLRAVGSVAGDGKPGERFWQIAAPDAERNVDAYPPRRPLVKKQPTFQLRDFSKFIRTFSWHDLPEVLLPATGYCLDVGSGTGRHKELVESRGYKWIGVDMRCRTNICSNAAALPVRSQSQAAVVAWQVLEYVEDPPKVFTEAARVLEPGGVFCGSISFLEPVHGHTYFNLSPLILEKLLRTNGFGDIEIKPGLNGFALMLWTFLRRVPIPHAEWLAIPLTFLMFVPFAAALFTASWLSWHSGFGTGHLMRWLSETAPLEFAGHVMFRARKRGRTKTCTSHS